jgi:hypothetical protein
MFFSAGIRRGIELLPSEQLPFLLETTSYNFETNLSAYNQGIRVTFRRIDIKDNYEEL